MNMFLKGRFVISQNQHGVAGQKGSHDGLDIVALEGNDVIFSNVRGVVTYAGWENPNNQKQGFGIYVRIRQDGTENDWYFGHLHHCDVKVGDRVDIGTCLGVQGNTGLSTGKHTHFCVRVNKSKTNVLNSWEILGVENKTGAEYIAEEVQAVQDSIKNYGTGDYKVIATRMNVRDGAGIDCRIKAMNELTQSAQKQGGYVTGVIFTALEVVNRAGESWARTPSGWVCLYNQDGEYCVKV